MKRIIIGICVSPVILACSILSAQDVGKISQPAQTKRVENGVVVDDVAQSETMWFYLHDLRRYDDPQMIIRRKAERKADQRRLRLASQKWFGYSAGRPTACSTPWTGVYSASWVGNGRDPFHWMGSGYATTTVYLNAASTRSVTTR